MPHLIRLNLCIARSSIKINSRLAPLVVREQDPAGGDVEPQASIWSTSTEPQNLGKVLIIKSTETLINPPSTNMAEKPCVIMTFPMSPYLEQEIESRFTLVKLWEEQNQDPRNFESVNAVVCNTKVGADASLVDSLPKLGIVSTYSVGLDKIDLDRCRERGIRVTNTPDVLTDDVADLAIGLALAVMRKVCAGDGFVRDGLWKKDTSFGLGLKFRGKSVGIIGLGRIGSAIAKRAEAFNCTVSYHSRTKKPNTNYKFYPDIIELASNSQILFVSCALTQETHHIVNRRVIEALGPKGILVNIGRGAHVDESELVSALSEGRLGGAGLDVFENEPNVSERLFGLSNVVMVPHVGSDTVETCKDMADLVVANLEAHFSNKPLLTPVL